MPLFQNHLRDSKDFSILEDSHVRVEFPNPKELFYAGEHLVGKVIVSLGRAIRCEKMTMQYTGYSDVSWETREGDRIKTHRNEEEYFNTSTVLLAPQPPDEHVTIPQGELTYPFEFNLPAHLPPAMITPHGKVVYYIAVGIVGIVSEVQGSTKARKKKYKFSKSNLVSGISLKVVPPPVNPTPLLLNPLENSVDKYLCCLCCRSGPIRLHYALPKKLHNAGEQINFSVEVDNTETNKQLGAVAVKLLAYYTFTSRSGNSQLPFRNEVSTLRLAENVQGGSVGKWANASLEIPSDTTPSFSIGGGIHLEYFFVLYVELSWAADPKIKIPVVISSGLRTSQPSGSTSLPQGNGGPGTAPDHTLTSASAQVDMPGTKPTCIPGRNGHPLTTITRQPTGDIGEQPPPPPYPTQETN